MDDFEFDNPNSYEDDGQPGAVAPEGDEKGENPEIAAPEDEHLTNAAMKAARLQGESAAEKRMKKQFDDEVAALGVINPYTEKPFKNFAEFKAYGKRVKAETMGKPVEAVEEDEENRAYLKKLREKEKETEQKNRDAEKQRQFIVSDGKAFQTKYPDIDIGKLEKNTKFQKFCGTRLYKEPLAELYEAFREFTSDTETEALAKKASKELRSTGAGGTAKDVALTSGEQSKLDAWNARYPDMRMSPQEWRTYQKK